MSTSPVPRARSIWWLAFLLAFVVAVPTSMVVCGAATRAIGAKPGQNPLKVVRHVERGLARLDQAGDRIRIAYLGDSTVAGYPRGEKLPARLGLALGDGYQVADLAYAAMTPPEYGYLAERIAEAKPDLVVWQLSLSHLAAVWQFSANRRGLSGWLGGRRMLEQIGLPIERIGLSVDQLLLYGAVVRLGGFDAWLRLRDEQSRVENTRRVLEDRIADASGRTPEERFRKASGLRYQIRHTERSDGRQRYNAAREREHYEDALTGLSGDHLVVAALAGGLRHYADAAVPVLVYLNPVNLDNLRRVGVLDEGVLDDSIDLIRRTAETHGASFLDLHAIFPDGHFADPAGHFRHDDELDAAALLIDRLEPAVRSAASRSREDR